MLDINFIRKDSEAVKSGLRAKRVDPAKVDEFLELDEKWRGLNKKFDDLRFEQKKLGKEKDISAAKAIKDELKEIESKLAELDKTRQEVLVQMPNLPLASVIVGKDESDNRVIKEVGEKPGLENPKDYMALAENLDLIDVERAAKVSGSRFGYLKGPAALLEFALVDLAFKVLIKEGFVPVVPPVLIKEKSMQAMGYLERGREEVYHFPADELCLVGTSEQAIGPMHMDETFSVKELPKRYAGFSTCFRREAGSYGKDTKGILRVHQFDKVEMFSFTAPEKSEAEHQFLLSLEEQFMQLLELPYRVVDICSADLGDPAAAKYDIEVWLPGENNGKGEYRETHSTSNTTDFQARRLNIRYKTADNKPEFVHMLNGTAIAIGRMIIAILENYQTKEGNIKIPKILQGYMGIKEIKK